MSVFLSSYITCSIVVLVLMGTYWYVDREWVIQKGGVKHLIFMTVLAVIFSYFFILLMIPWAIREVRGCNKEE